MTYILKTKDRKLTFASNYKYKSSAEKSAKKYNQLFKKNGSNERVIVTKL